MGSLIFPQSRLEYSRRILVELGGPRNSHSNIYRVGRASHRLARERRIAKFLFQLHGLADDSQNLSQINGYAIDDEASRIECSR
jgi:hypothetical protein